jgi:hypothetical protein
MSDLPGVILWNSAGIPKCHVAGNLNMATSILRERHDDAPSSGAIFSNSVRVAMVDVLGESGAASISYHIKLGPADIDPVAVQERLGRILGDGAVVLERAIVMEFYRELKLPHEFTSILALSPGATVSRLDFERLVHAGVSLSADLEKNGGRQFSGMRIFGSCPSTACSSTV